MSRITSNARPIMVSILMIAVALIGFGVFGTAKFLTSYFGPSVTITEQILTDTDLRSLPFFKAQVTGEQALNSGLREVTRTTEGDLPRSDDTITGYFGYLLLGKHLMMVRTLRPINPRVVEYSGVLTAVGADKIALEAYHKYLTEFPQARDMFVPMLLDINYDVTPWFMGLVFEIILLVGGIVGLIKVRRGDFDLRL